MDRRMLSVCFAVGFVLVAAGAARAAEVGVSEHTILIGRVTPKGSVNFAGMAKQRTAGADAYVAAVNAAGGVHGRRIVLKDRDDAYDRERASREVKALIGRARGRHRVRRQGATSISSCSGAAASSIEDYAPGGR